MSATGQALNTARPETFLAFDVGRKRTGVAYASRFLGHAEPQGSIQAEGDRRWPLVARHIETWQPQALVVGVPFHPDGAEHDNTRFARRFARELRQRFALPPAWVPEIVREPRFGERAPAQAAVLIPIAQWQQIQSAARPSLKALLLAAEGRTDRLAPERTHERGQARRRKVEALR